MKKFVICISLVVMIVLCFVCFPQNKKEDVDYLRLHIRANSNLNIDQDVKYKVKDVIVEYLTPYFSQVKSKNEAIKKVNDLSKVIEIKCEQVLRLNGFSYSANIKVNNEFFPARKYDNVVLESGYYDAVIIELGEAKGDNWWCVMYPPLCFVNKNQNETQIKFESRIKKWCKSIFN